MLKKRWPVLLMLLVMMMLVVVVQGCSSSSDQEQPSQQAENHDQPANDQPADQPAQHEQVMLRITSGAAGGLWQVYGTAWGKILQDNLPYAQVQVESSGGGVANLVAVNEDKNVLGMTQNAVTYEGYNGLAWAEGKEYRDARSLFAVYPSISDIVAPTKNGIKTIQDLEGKVICLGPAGGGIDILGRQIFDVLGIKPRKIVNMNFADIVQSIKDGTIDAYAIAAGHPFSSTLELEQTMDLTHIEMSEADNQKFLEKYPYYPLVPLDADMYKGMDHDYDNLTVYSFAIANKDLPDDVAYDITKAVLENNDVLVSAVKAAKDTIAENIKYINMPVHPGALKYYREIGIEVPDAIIPPEAK